MPGVLYVVSTPIGNLDDITLRALQTLKSVGLIAAEDTRRTGTLLRHFGITTPTTSFHEHNERQKLRHVLDRLLEGADVALVSDAGTPLVADPGRRLIAAAAEAGIRVVPVPGASAVLSALVASGEPADEFVFAGFAPPRSSDRKRWLAGLAREVRPVVFFESPHRITQTLSELGDILGDRPITVARELTKMHEQVVHSRANDAGGLSLPEKGEFTIVLGAAEKTQGADAHGTEGEIVDYFYHLTNREGLARRPAVTQTAHKFGRTAKEVYGIIEKLKHSCRLDRSAGDLLP